MVDADCHGLMMHRDSRFRATGAANVMVDELTRMMLARPGVSGGTLGRGATDDPPHREGDSAAVELRLGNALNPPRPPGTEAEAGQRRAERSTGKPRARFDDHHPLPALLGQPPVDDEAGRSGTDDEDFGSFTELRSFSARRAARAHLRHFPPNL